jgi:DNA-binding transcriptional ArsR family regulator
MDEVKDAAMGTGAQIDDVRRVDDVETLKALSDPLRLSILRVMMDSAGEPRAWTAKELASELAEPQTKLYRHLKHLEEARLIKVAETRVVSGIVEQRYVSAQRTVELSRDFLATTPGSEPSEDQRSAVVGVVGSAVTGFVRGFELALRSGAVGLGATDPERRPAVMVGDLRMPADRAAAFHARFKQLIDEVNAEPNDPEGVPVHVMVALYSPEE